ncbi:hypothetical protein [Hyalangium rubrum]|uniref:Lipoprotein n=1 Tax=Hyalangium rubrum TaxID=3103134 RepID=A0ABU5GV96_9BACT|nr:hypothetical protein [Hyalangium sp. s54d21]MDY7225094.1 hypothetical protein [Hyalangium sp. s54d21]
MTRRHLCSVLSAAALSLTACDGTSGSGGPNSGPPTEPTGAARIPAYLQASPYTRLVIEVDATEGFAPRTAVESAVVATLKAEVDKPQGVVVTRDQLALPRKGSTYEWTESELRLLAGNTFSVRREAGDIRMHVLFLDGQYKGGTVLGLAWDSTHLVVFKETIERQCRSGLGATLGDRVCEAVEQGVWVHELGHLLGLVNTGLAMTAPHESAEHPGHDGNERCVMFWAFDTSSSLDKVARELLGGEAVSLQFDEACKADLASGRRAP